MNGNADNLEIQKRLNRLQKLKKQEEQIKRQKNLKKFDEYLDAKERHLKELKKR